MVSEFVETTYWETLTPKYFTSLHGDERFLKRPGGRKRKMIKATTKARKITSLPILKIGTTKEKSITAYVYISLSVVWCCQSMSSCSTSQPTLHTFVTSLFLWLFPQYQTLCKKKSQNWFHLSSLINNSIENVERFQRYMEHHRCEMHIIPPHVIEIRWYTMKKTNLPQIYRIVYTKKIYQKGVIEKIFYNMLWTWNQETRWTNPQSWPRNCWEGACNGSLQLVSRKTANFSASTVQVQTTNTWIPPELGTA